MLQRPELPQQDYRVIVGHMTVTVSATSQDDARFLARQKLCVEMPRLWDVIVDLDPRSFQIQQLDQ